MLILLSLYHQTTHSMDTITLNDIKKLDTSDLIRILEKPGHVKLFGDETREELEQILVLNIKEDLIDEIEVIIVLSGY